MRRRRVLLLAVASVAVPAALAGRAAAGSIALPATSYPVTSVPPLTASTPRVATLVPGSIDTFQRVVVLVDGRGRPIAAQLADRLVLHATGDYSFAVGGPFTDVRPGPRTESDPGFQTDAIVWRGFAVRRRVLDAVATMRVRETSRFLPLRVSLLITVDGRPLVGTERRRGRVTVDLRVTNVTQTDVRPFAGAAEPVQAARVLDRIRDSFARGRHLPAGSLQVRGGPRARRIRAVAALRVAGALRFDAATLTGATVRGGTVIHTKAGTLLRFKGTLGDAGPLTLRVQLNAEGASVGVPRLELAARPVWPERMLRPPGAPTWTALARRRTLDGGKLVDVVLASLLSAARAGQYQEFVQTPGNVAIRGTDYVFRTAPVAAVQPRSVASSGGGNNPLATVGLVAAALLLLGAAVVAWAHL